MTGDDPFRTDSGIEPADTEAFGLARDWWSDGESRTTAALGGGPSTDAAPSHRAPMTRRGTDSR
ncbi:MULTISPECIES: hypothetical protein [Halorussus]|uniref:hypothetical protein n=1 Tax=Halorussus TaxID=1070314 RepID=UPI000E20CB1C|nr:MULTISPECIES: hypothetical protein [Halorussus]NHN57639.1 hypothetical protein [Halorussus sp. JP-T4]